MPAVAEIRSSPSADFTALSYTPPASARDAKRILVKPNLGYPEAHPVTDRKSVV